MINHGKSFTHAGAIEFPDRLLANSDLVNCALLEGTLKNADSFPTLIQYHNDITRYIANYNDISCFVKGYGDNFIAQYENAVQQLSICRRTCEQVLHLCLKMDKKD